MIIVRQLHLAGGEVLKWLAILTLASAVAALAARLAAGGEPVRIDTEPNRLPAATWQTARPMSPAFKAVPGEENPIPAAQQIWQILADQKSGNLASALEGWRHAPLACEAEPWRHIAQGQAALGLHETELAYEHLVAAQGLDPDNAVARYFLGLLRLEQAAGAREWPDALGPAYVRLAATRSGREPTLTKSMYELAARMELEAALETARHVPFDLPLCESPSEGLALEPTVRDLLIATGAADFEGKAHHLLSYLLMEHGAAREAEQHLDSAAALGQSIVFGYHDLGALYERQHEHLDAFRAYTKALGQGGSVARPAQGILRNLRLAIVEEFDR